MMPAGADISTGKSSASKEKNMKRYFLILALLWTAVSGFTQEIEGIGLETSYNAASYSLSLQTMTSYGGWSIDWIQKSGSSGFLGSLFLGLPIGDIFKLYGGGGLGIGIDDSYFFAWKVDGGAMVWLFDLFYVKAGVTYDNIREFAITAGLGLKWR
jgi:hypothetical protein